MANNFGTMGNDLIEGTVDNDLLAGYLGDDTLRGGAGNDTLIGEYGDDILDGGAGVDAAQFGGALQDYKVTWSSATGQYRIVDSVSGRDGSDIFTGIEFLLFANGSFNVSDVVQAGSGRVVLGSPVSDMLTGTAGDDLLYGLAGDDTLVADPGNDLLDGGAGRNTVVFSGAFSDYLVTWDSAVRQYRFVDAAPWRDGVDRVTGVETFRFADGVRGIADLVRGAGDGMLLAGGGGYDALVGGAGYDTLQGGAGNDTLTGGGSNDLVDGGLGTDTARFAGVWADYRITFNGSTGQYTVIDLRSGRDGMDTVTGVEYFSFADGTRTASGSLPNTASTRTGSAFADNLSGSSAPDSLRGLDGNDFLDGRSGNDTLEGGAGDDRLIGGAGNDWLDGGSGAGDRAVFSGTRSGYTVQWDAAAGQYTVTDNVAGRDGIDRVTGVELFEFGGQVLTAADLLRSGGDGLQLAGTAAGELLRGTVGYDVLQGLDGNDSLDGGPGADQLDGGAGDDGLAGGAGTDRLVGGSGTDTAYFFGSYGDYEIRWEEAARLYVITDRLGRDGSDFVSGVEYFAFSDGVRSIADLVPGMGDGEVLVGTQWGDWLVGGEGYDVLQGLAGDDMLMGGAAGDQLVGGDGNDVLDGAEGEDTLDGGAGDDALDGGAGDDRIDGGDGYDRVHFSGASWDYDIRWDAASSEIVVTDHWAGRDGTDTVRNVEEFDFAEGPRTAADVLAGKGLTLVGTASNDDLAGTPLHDVLQGLEGDDSLAGLDGDDTLLGGAGNDFLRGDAGDDVIDGGAGKDVVAYGGSSWDYAIGWDAQARAYTISDRWGGHDGNDTVRGVEVFAFADGIRTIADLVPGVGDGDTVVGTAGDDVLLGMTGYDLVQGLEGNDWLAGQEANDTIEGGAGDDQIEGGAGDDRIDGGSGFDFARYSGSSWEYDVRWDAAAHAYVIADRVFGRDGIDTVSNVEVFGFAEGARDWSNLVPGAGDGFTLVGTEDADTVYGSAGYDVLTGLGGNDFLAGLAASDVIDAGAGDDQIDGGGGDDRIEGGSGFDFVRFTGYSWEYDIRWDAAARQYVIADLAFERDGTDTVSNVEVFGFGDGARDWSNLVAGAGDGFTVTGTDDADTVYGSAGYDVLAGLGGNDFLAGLAANDVIDAGAGDDQIDGGAGDDRIEGGSGFDFARYSGYSWEYDIRWDADAREYVISDRAGFGRDGTDTVSNVEVFGFADGVRDWSNLVPGAGDGVTIVGTEDADMIYGTAGYDRLAGEGGNDFLGALAGNDLIDGGAGDDFIRGDAGDDRIEGGAGFDRVHFDGWFSEYDISWNAATAEYTVADRMPGRDGVDLVRGVELFEFADRAVAAADLVPGTGAGPTFVGTPGDDALVGTMGHDLVQGLEGNDFLGGLSGNDTLEGGAGDDYLRGDQGDDRIAGGTGVDRVHFEGFFGDYAIAWDASTREYTIADMMAGRDGTDVVQGVELFEFVDGTRMVADLVPGTGDGATVIGTPGDDQLVGGFGYDLVQGLEGNDFLGGLSANDTLEGGAGDDFLRGDQGDDLIDGGAGMDRAHFDGWSWEYDIVWQPTARGYMVTDRVAGRDGTDVVRGVELFEFMDGMLTVPGAASGDPLVGTAGDDQLIGTGGHDLVQGLDGNDFLGGLDGDDTLEGGAGDDFMRGDKGDDHIDGGAGMDIVHFDGWSWEYDVSWQPSTGEFTLADRMAGRDGVDVVRGAELFEFMDGLRTGSDLVPIFGDTLVGTGADDTLLGGAGFDLLQGLEGNDKLAGGAGDDTLDAGGGDDDLRGEWGDDHIDGGAGSDVIHFNGYLADYDVSWNAATQEYRIADRMMGRDGTDFVRGVEVFDFLDATRTVDDLVPGVVQGGTFVGTAGDDTLLGGAGPDLLQGLDGNDKLGGGAGIDTIDAGAGDDYLRGDGGDDLLLGGKGMDTAAYQGWSADYLVTVDSASGDLIVADRMAGRDGTDRVNGVEAFSFMDGVFSADQMMALQPVGMAAPPATTLL